MQATGMIGIATTLNSHASDRTDKTRLANYFTHYLEGLHLPNNYSEN